MAAKREFEAAVPWCGINPSKIPEGPSHTMSTVFHETFKVAGMLYLYRKLKGPAIIYGWGAPKTKWGG